MARAMRLIISRISSTQLATKQIKVTLADFVYFVCLRLSLPPKRKVRKLSHLSMDKPHDKMSLNYFVNYALHRVFDVPQTAVR